ncbi:MAG TPA: hypothetical protein VIW73_03865 [Candidatus Cybelea sp.]
MIIEAPLPSPVAFVEAVDRLDLLLAALAGLGTDELGTGSAELFWVDFGAVVFAITLFLCVRIS